MVSLFSLFLSLHLSVTPIQSNPFVPSDENCLEINYAKKGIEKAFKKPTWLKDPTEIQTHYLIQRYLLEHKELPQGDKVAIVQLKDKALVFFIAGPSFCSALSLSKEELNYLLHIE